MHMYMHADTYQLYIVYVWSWVAPPCAVNPATQVSPYKSRPYHVFIDTCIHIRYKYNKCMFSEGAPFGTVGGVRSANPATG